MKKTILIWLTLAAVLIMMCGCSNSGSNNYQNQQTNQQTESSNLTGENPDEYILANDALKEKVNNALRGYYFTFNLGDGVEAEYSFNDGVATVTTFLNGNQFGATETGSYQVYENVIISNFGYNDVVIGYEFTNGEIELTYVK